MASELTTFVTTIVDGTALLIVRLHALGFRNIIVSNIALMACTPLSTMELEFTACSTNSTILTQTSLHNSLLQMRVKGLNLQLRGVHIVIVDQTKAFEELFTHGADYGNFPLCHSQWHDSNSH